MGHKIEAEVRFCKMLYPSSGHKNGDFGIVSVYLEKAINGEPKAHDVWKTLTLVGNMPELKKGITYKLKAEEEYNEKYKSFQYKVKYIGVPIDINSVESQKTFLKSILTENQVNSLFEKFENPLEEIINNNLKGLCSIKGIKEKTATEIIKKTKNSLSYYNIFVELEKYDLTEKMLDKLMEKYNSPEVIIEKIKKNPYILATEIDGVGFKKADEIALKGGISEISKERLSSFIIYYLQEQASTGRSYIPQTELMSNIINILNFDTSNKEGMSNLTSSIYNLREKEILWWDKNKSIMGLYKYLKMEYAINAELHRILKGENKFIYSNWGSIVNEIEKEQGWNYTREQREGVKTALDYNLVLVTGLAGTGKTTVTKAMTKVLKKYFIVQCALSGRASQRITEATEMEASTIHRLLKFKKGGGFEHNKENPLGCEIVILDEASMVNLELFLALLRAIKTGTKLIILGDYGQLSPIGAGNVFMDMLESGVVPVVKLTIVHRQAQASAIISKSISVRYQNQLFEPNFVGNVVLGELKDLELNIKDNDENLLNDIVHKYELHLNRLKDFHKVQIVVPTKQRGELCCSKLNNAIQKKFNYHKEEDGIFIRGKNGYQYYLFENDKIIVTKNNYKIKNVNDEDTPVFNGNLGTIISIDTKNKEALIDIQGVGRVIFSSADLKSVELGYAITCHKLQGSSANTVIVAIDFSGYSLLSCEWIYTAITRAEKYCVLYGINKAIRFAISKLEAKNKATFLPYALKGIKMSDL